MNCEHRSLRHSPEKSLAPNSPEAKSQSTRPSGSVPAGVAGVKAGSLRTGWLSSHGARDRVPPQIMQLRHIPTPALVGDLDLEGTSTHRSHPDSGNAQESGLGQDFARLESRHSDDDASLG